MPKDNSHLRKIMNRGLTLITPGELPNDSEEGGSDIIEFLLAEPYSTISGYFLDNKFKEIVPVDSESGLFLPLIPVSERSDSNDLKALISKHGIVIPSKGTILAGREQSSEHPLILFSIACFSLFVKFFHLILRKKNEGKLKAEDFEYIDRIRMHEYRYTPSSTGKKWIFDEHNIPDRITAAGRSIVSDRLVDSIFGNISALEEGHVFISKAGSFLDDLENQVVKVPLNGTIGSSINPSSEVEVHRNIYKASRYTHIIHGHPLFTVILSLDKKGTGDTLLLHSGESIPVIDGEDESGNSNLPGSVPSVIQKNGNAIVKGHGIFSAGEKSFSNTLQNMKDIENYCRDEYFRRLK